MFKLGKNIVLDLQSRWVKKIFLFFYEAGCSGTKLDLKEEFEISNWMEKLDLKVWFDIYVEKKDKEKFNGATITRIDGKKIKYIFTSSNIGERCGCGSSFSFEKKKLKINLEKLENIKQHFWK